jgi:hypothetical protein
MTEETENDIPDRDTAICSDGTPDTFVPDRLVQKEFSITPMTLSRWDRDPTLRRHGWAQPIKIRNRNFRSRRALEAFKATMLRIAVSERNKTVTPQ